MTNTTTEQRITITVQGPSGTPEDHDFIIDNRRQGFTLVHQLRAKGYLVPRYVFSPLTEKSPAR